MNRFKQVVSALGVSMVLALVSAQASAGLDLRFRFLSESPFYSGEVSGTIFGLLTPTPGGSTGSSATSVVLRPSGLTDAVTFAGDDAFANAFSIFNSVGSGFAVDSFLFQGLSDGIALCLSDVALNCGGAQGYVDAGNFLAQGFDQQGQPIGDPATFAVSEAVDVTAVPTPASFALLVMGVCALMLRSRGARV